MKSVTFSNGSLTLAGNLHLPPDFEEGKRYPAIACVHPGGGVKEQTAGLYAARLAAEGFVALAFDASFQGESGGEPRSTENPHARVEDARSAIDYLVTQDFVDPDRVGILGVCAGGGYAINAAMADRRVKAVGGVSTVNIGDMFRRGWDGTGDIGQSLALLEMGSAQRTVRAQGGEGDNIPFSPTSLDGVDDRDMREAYDYYRTPRAQHCNAPGFFPASSLVPLVTFDAFHLADSLLTQPLQLVAGSDAGSLWFSKDILAKAASAQKDLHIVEGGTHLALYDQPAAVDEAMANLAPFYRNHLAA
ncbi:alpha/beta hydrolase [Sphingopyxis sp. 550A]